MSVLGLEPLRLRVTLAPAGALVTGIFDRTRSCAEAPGQPQAAALGSASPSAPDSSAVVQSDGVTGLLYLAWPLDGKHMGLSGDTWSLSGVASAPYRSVIFHGSIGGMASCGNGHVLAGGLSPMLHRRVARHRRTEEGGEVPLRRLLCQ